MGKKFSGTILLVSLIGGLLTSCSSISKEFREPVEPILLQEIMGDPSGLPQSVDVLALDNELRSYVNTHIDRSWTPKKKLEMLREMIFSDDLLGLEYDTSHTRTAQETFTARLGNCLSMTNLYIAMARYVELDAHYQIVPTLPWWDRSNNTMIWNEHINSIGDLRGHTQYVLDFIPAPYTAIQKEAKTVSDRYATALYHNNLGAEAILNKQLDVALAQLRMSLSIEPELADTWNNMAIVQRRLGRDDLTEAALLHAIRLNNRHFTAMSNLANLYQRQNHVKKAEYYRKKIRKHKSTNPYYQYAMGDKALEEGDYKLAIRKLKRAILLGNNDPDFYQLLHVAYERIGNLKKSQQNLLLANYYRQQPHVSEKSTIRVTSDSEVGRPSNIRRISVNPK